MQSIEKFVADHRMALPSDDDDRCSLIRFRSCGQWREELILEESMEGGIAPFLRLTWEGDEWNVDALDHRISDQDLLTTYLASTADLAVPDPKALMRQDTNCSFLEFEVMKARDDYGDEILPQRIR